MRDWRSEAACLDHDTETQDLWFSASPSEQRAAVAICADCPVLDECDRMATTVRPYAGVWAGQLWIGGRVGRIPLRGRARPCQVDGCDEPKVPGAGQRFCGTHGGGTVRRRRRAEVPS